MRYLLLALMCLAVLSNWGWSDDRYGSIVNEDHPVAWWRFDGDEARRFQSTGSDLPLKSVGKVTAGQAGPRPAEYPDFDAKNGSIAIANGKNYLVVADPGDESALDFTNGDALTLEAWVQISGPLSGGYPYIIGKGRTFNPGMGQKNQNYGLRLDGKTLGLSFLFVDAVNAASQSTISDSNGHRWTSDQGVADDGLWHHVAVTYEFGKPKSIRGYIDGQAVAGKWDMGGETEHPPVVDNDELWIGASMGGGSTFAGGLDEIAIYRTALSPERIQAHANIKLENTLFVFDQVDPATVPTDKVRVDVFEKVSAARKWTFRTNPEAELLYEVDRFALRTIPPKYDEHGVIVDRPVPMLLHMVSSVPFEAGEHEFILRSLDASRLYVDGQLVAETGFKDLNGDAHNPYYHLPTFGPDMLSIPAGHEEKRGKLSLTAGRHMVSLYRLLGNKGHGQHLGEMVVGVSGDGSPFQMLSPVKDIPFTDDAWLTFLDEDTLRQRDWAQRVRLAKSVKEQQYWDERHAYAREHCAIPAVELPANSNRNPIDVLIESRLQDQGLEPTAVIDDFAFLRRLSLDTTGRIPTPAMLADYLADPPAERRQRAVDRLLADSAWADHWVGYWQDVLAENPGLTKPELNNTGPFRWFLYEAMLDNMPLDRFASEIALMRGSAHAGGPAGFSIASQNDVPMAAKAHILGNAFLAVEMKCARCHDAPYHDLTQGDLFGLAAMLKRAPEAVPGTSSIPLSPEELAKKAVKISVPAGSSVKPNWPFAEFVSVVAEGAAAPQPLPVELLHNPEDSREQLAAMLTSPLNSRFPRVMVNRIWERFFGRALIEPVEDWESPECLQPDVLDYLAHELVTNNYDLKHLSRLILTSQTYQRAAVPGIERTSEQAGWFRGPVAHKMTGEQLTDSLFLAAGKPFNSEELTMDADGRQNDTIFGHLGVPRRTWQLVSVSNERDRPSMSLAVAQSLIDLASAYGWRQQRQDPLTVRPDPVTPLQPMALAHGTAPSRIVDFSDRSALTAIALEDQPVEEFVEKLFQRLLTRSPLTEERELFVELLTPGYAERIIAGPEVVQPRRIFRSGITWATHFAPESDVEAMTRQRETLKGDLPTHRLQADWRERAEDLAWTLINSPEFVIVP